MKKLLFILMFFPLFASAQTGVKWDRYFFSGSMAIGKGIDTFANATAAAKDSATYADKSAWLELGREGTDRGFLIARVVDVADIDSPARGLMCYQISDATIQVFDGSVWSEVGGGGSGSLYDTTYLYYYIDSGFASISAGVVDSSVFVTVSRLKDTAAAIRADFPTPSGFDSTYIYAALEDTAAAIRADFPTQIDTTSLSARINLKLNITDTTGKWLPIGTIIPTPYDTAAIYYQLGLRVKYTDTAAMLNNYTLRSELQDTAQAIRNDFPSLTGYVTQSDLDDTASAIRGDIPDISDFVPYTGATGNVNIGVHTMEATRVATDTIEPRTSAGLHIHNASHQDIMIAGAGGGQNLTIAAPTNVNAGVSVTNSASAIGLNVQGTNPSFRTALLTTSAGAGIQGYNDGLSSARNMHMQAAGANLRIGSGTITAQKFQVNGKMWINTDSVSTGSTGTDNVLMLSGGDVKQVDMATLSAGITPAPPQDLDSVLSTGSTATNKKAIINSTSAAVLYEGQFNGTSTNEIGHSLGRGYYKAIRASNGEYASYSYNGIDFNGTALTPGNAGTIAVTSDIPAKENVLVIAISDETTALTTGTGKSTFRMPYGATITAVRASVNTVSSSGTPTFDINEAGTTILSTKITIDASEKSSVTAAVAPVISDPNISDDAEMTIDIDVAGTGAKGAKIAIYYTY